jgi:hypothetical protein
MTIHDRRVAATAKGQLGSFNSEQAHAAGLSDRQLRGRVQSGHLDQVGVRTFRSPSTPSTPLADLVALVLDIGEPCWVSGPTAAALHGFDGFSLRRPFHVTVPRGRNIARTVAQVHTSIELPAIDREEAEGLPVTSPARTLIDLARHVDAERLTAALDAGLRDRKFTETHLHRRIVALRTSGRYGVPKLLDVIAGGEVTRGGHSWLEREFLRLTAAAGLPRPTTQPVLTRARDRLVRVDCRYPRTRVVVELLGYRFHRSTGQLRRDVERMNALLLQGMAPFQFTYTQVVDEPDIVVSTVAHALGTVCVTHNDRSRRCS